MFSKREKFVKLDTGKNSIEYPWLQFLIPNPHTERLRFYDDLVKPLYLSAHQHIGSGFQQYLLQQQKETWDIHCAKSSFVNQEIHFFENEKSGHYQNIVKFTTESPEESVFKQIDVNPS